MIENGRAKDAFEKVRQLSTEELEHYVSYIRKMPMMIKTNGLAQTLAFYLSANKREYQIVYKHLSSWVMQPDTKKRLGLDKQKANDLMEATIALESADYRTLTVEIMAYLEWLKRFSEVVAEFPEVVEFYRMSGDVDYLLRVVVPDIAAYDAFYKRLIAKIEIRDVSSAFAMEQIKYTTELPLDYMILDNQRNSED